MENQYIQVERNENGVVTITLNAPEQLNAWYIPLMEEMTTELDYINDQRFALQWSQFQINKNKIGRNRLYMELSGKGIDKVIIEKTLNAIYEDNPENDIA